MQSPEQMIREKRMRCTPQRIAVLRAVASHDRHLSAEEIYAFVHTSMLALALATVYAILEMFTLEAIVDESRISFQ